MTRSVDMCCDNECQIDGPTRSERSSSARQSEARALSRGSGHSHREMLRLALLGNKEQVPLCCIMCMFVVCSLDCRFSCCLLVVVMMEEPVPLQPQRHRFARLSRQSKIRTSPPRDCADPHYIKGREHDPWVGWIQYKRENRACNEHENGTIRVLEREATRTSGVRRRERERESCNKQS